MTKTARILVVDDDAAVRAGLRRSLVRHFKADVSEAADGVVALAHLVKYPCDLVLLDLKMPVLDGLKTLQAIRKSPRCDVPVVMLTGASDAAQVKEALRLGVVHYFVKPVEPTALVERLGALLPRDDESSTVAAAGTGHERPTGRNEADTLALAAASGVRRTLEQMTGRHVQAGANVHLQETHHRHWAMAVMPLEVDRTPWQVSVFSTMVSASVMAASAVESGTVTGESAVADTMAWLARVAGDGMAQTRAVTGHGRPVVTCDLPSDPTGSDAPGPRGERWLFVPTSGIAVLVRVGPAVVAS